MGAELVVLGAGSALPRAGYGCSGYALVRAGEGASGGDDVTLLDCGPGTIRSLGAAGIALEEVRRVVLSHFHVDHCLDLFALFFARRNPAFAPPPELELVGPRGLARLVEETGAALGPWARDPNATVREIELDAGERGRLDRPGVRWSCVATGHSPEALAWRADLEDGSALAYSGDTGEAEPVARLAHGVDLFVLECSFPDGGGVANHLTPSGAARMAALAAPHRLLLTHFYPSLDPEEAGRSVAEAWGGEVALARDGARFAVGGVRPR